MEWRVNGIITFAHKLCVHVETQLALVRCAFCRVMATSHRSEILLHLWQHYSVTKCQGTAAELKQFFSCISSAAAWCDMLDDISLYKQHYSTLLRKRWQTYYALIILLCWRTIQSARLRFETWSRACGDIGISCSYKFLLKIAYFTYKWNWEYASTKEIYLLAFPKRDSTASSAFFTSYFNCIQTENFVLIVSRLTCFNVSFPRTRLSIQSDNRGGDESCMQNDFLVSFQNVKSKKKYESKYVEMRSTWNVPGCTLAANAMSAESDASRVVLQPTLLYIGAVWSNCQR